MTALAPGDRPTFEGLLHKARGSVFPEVFYSFLHGYVASINELPTPSPFAPSPPSITTPSISSSSATKATPKGGGTVTPIPVIQESATIKALPSDADHRMDRIWADHESVESYLMEAAGEETVMNVRVEYGLTEEPSKPFQVIFLLLPDSIS